MKLARFKKEVIVVGLSVLCIITGCNVKPKETNTIKKSQNDQMIQKAQKPSLKNKGEIKDYEIKDQFSNQKKTLQVSLDMKGSVNTERSYPITEVKERTLKKNDVAKFMEVFVEDRPFYQLQNEFSKQMIEDRIADLKSNYDIDEPSEIEGLTIGDEIKYLKKELKSAKDSVDDRIGTKELSADKDGGKIEGYTKSTEGRKQYLLIQNENKETQGSVTYTNFPDESDWSYYDMTGLMIDESKKRLPNISVEDAAKKANSLLGKLGINANGEYGINSIKQAYNSADAENIRDITKKVDVSYLVVYTRKINGIISNLDEDFLEVDNQSQQRMIDQLANKHSSKESASFNPQENKLETILVLVNDSGVIGFKWNSPCTVVKEVVSDSNLISFETISKIVKKMILLRNEPENKNSLYNIKCDKMELGFERVQQKGKKVLYVPAWRIWGNIHVENKKKYEMIDGKKCKIPAIDLYQNILTLNAVDGSVISENGIH